MASRYLLLAFFGQAEVQAAQDIQESAQVVGRADREAATPVCALGMDERFQVQPIDGTSGVKADSHAPFCGSQGVRSPGPPGEAVRA